MLKIVAIIAICPPTTVLLDDSIFPAPPTLLPFFPLLSSFQGRNARGRGCDLPSRQSRLRAALLLIHEMHTPHTPRRCTAFVPPTPTPCLGLPASVITFHTSPSLQGGVRRERHSLSGTAASCRQLSGADSGRLHAGHRHTSQKTAEGLFLQKDLKTNLTVIGLRCIFPLNRHWFKTHISSFSRIHRKMCDFTHTWSLR